MRDQAGVDAHFRLHGAFAMVLGEFAFTCRELLGWEETRALSLLCGTSTTSTQPARALRETALTGIAASPSRYTGPVRIIRSEAEFDRLRAGDVLVCPATSPVWSVLFPSVGALVTDHGRMRRWSGTPCVHLTRPPSRGAGVSTTVTRSWPSPQGPLFGVNLIPEGTGPVAVGDPVEVLG
jgi:hypothetical protein